MLIVHEYHKKYILYFLIIIWIPKCTLGILNKNHRYNYYYHQPQQFNYTIFINKRIHKITSEINLNERIPVKAVAVAAATAPTTATLSTTANKFHLPHNINFTKNKRKYFPVRRKPQLTNEIDEQTDYSKFLQNLIVPSPPPSKKDKIDYNYLLPDPKTGVGLDIEAFQKYYIDSANSSAINQPRTTNTVFPGTIWCGPGNRAPSENSVGIFYLTDNCCREHDQCPQTIQPDQTFNGLHNNGYFTRSHCDCDRDFYMCLKEANTFVSYKVGFAYFNILRPQCFRLEYPIVQCTQPYLTKCLNYAVDDKKEKIWQWFDNHPY